VTISAKSIILSETASRAFSPGTLVYYRARFRNRLYDLVLSKFRQAEANEGLTRAELARRTGRRPEVVTRLLGAPGNWRLDTVSDLLMGIAGEELDATSSSPLTRPPRNYRYRHVFHTEEQEANTIDAFQDRGSGLRAEPEPELKLRKLLGTNSPQFENAL
jgi:hypothetical protein